MQISNPIPVASESTAGTSISEPHDKPMQGPLSITCRNGTFSSKLPWSGEVLVRIVALSGQTLQEQRGTADDDGCLEWSASEGSGLRIVELEGPLGQRIRGTIFCL